MQMPEMKRVAKLKILKQIIFFFFIMGVLIYGLITMPITFP